MVNAAHVRLNAADRSYFAILKKEVHALALSADISAKKIAEVDIVVAEIVSNLAKHAGGGDVFVKLIEEKGIQGIEIISIDNGPGIGDLNRMMQDGASTKNTLGQGLGAIKRLSDFAQIYSQKGWGTILISRFYNEKLPDTLSKAGTEIRSLVIPKAGETECGDSFYYKQTKEHIKLFLGDGLGHGKEAALAVKAAVEAFKICSEDSPLENLRFIHSAVKKTRGLVASIAIFSIKERKWRLCGIGNILTRFYSGSASKNHMSYNGIVGLNIPNSMKDQEIEYEVGQSIIMCSDGIKSRWELTKYPGILRLDLSLVNAAILKDFARNTDDMSIASCKINL